MYFKKSKSRGKEYMQVWDKEKGFLVSLGPAEKAFKDSVELKELREQTEILNKIRTECSTDTGA